MSNNNDYFIDFQNLKNSRNGNLLIIFKHLTKRRKRQIYIYIIVFRILRVSKSLKISISMNFQSISENKLI